MEQNEKVTLQKLKKEMEQMRAEYEARLQALGEERNACMAPEADECEQQKRAQRARTEREKQEKWLNEYVEISKFYGTPKSRAFVNGLLDRLIQKLTEEGAIVKKGKGLQ